MKKFKFPSFKFNFKWPRFKNLHLKNRFGKTFPLNTSVISGWPEIILYFIFVIVGVVLFYLWNRVSTKEWNIYMQQLEDGVEEREAAAYDFELTFPASFSENYALGNLKIGMMDPSPWCKSSKSTYFVDKEYSVSRFGALYTDSIDKTRQYYLDTLLDFAKKDSSFLTKETDNIFFYCVSIGIPSYFIIKNDGVEKPERTIEQYNLKKKRKEGSNYYADVSSLTLIDPHSQNSLPDFVTVHLTSFTPSYFSPYDLSCAYFKIKLQTDNIQATSLKIKYSGCAELTRLNPEPDEMDYDYVYYYDSLKLSEIEFHGLRFFAKFPELENKQYVRIFALTAVLSIFATTLLAFLLNAIFASFSFTRKKQEDAQTEKSTDTPQE